MQRSSRHHGAEIAFLGRSNVGKSSLAECAGGREGRQSFADPGTNARHQFFPALRSDKNRARLIFADLPGYGYAKISKSISAEWPKFIDPYLAERETLKLCVCLVDSNIPPQPNDGKLVDWLRHAGRGFHRRSNKDRSTQRQRTHPKSPGHQERIRSGRGACRCPPKPAPV